MRDGWHKAIQMNSVIQPTVTYLLYGKYLCKQRIWKTHNPLRTDAYTLKPSYHAVYPVNWYACL